MRKARCDRFDDGDDEDDEHDVDDDANDADDDDDDKARQGVTVIRCRHCKGLHLDFTHRCANSFIFIAIMILIVISTIMITIISSTAKKSLDKEQ